MQIGGIITPEVRKEGRRIGFKVVDIFSRKEGWLAKVGNYPNSVKFGRYSIFVEEFEKVALPALSFALKKCDLVVIDEIGKMEFFSKKFKEKIFEVLKSDKPLLAVLHRKFISSFKTFGEVVRITEKNRDKIKEKIVEKFEHENL